MKSMIICGLAISLLVLNACNNTSSEPDRRNEADVVMVTDRGDIFIKLFDDTPRHKENFLKLTREGFYDGVSFHRVMSKFMIQTGDPRTKIGATDMQTDDAGYNLDAEINETRIHTEGMVAAARYPDNINPNWESSSSQFYIVTGTKNSDAKLDTVETNYNYIRQGRLYQEFQELVKNKEYDESFNNFLADKEFVYFGYSDEQRAAYREKRGVPHLDFMYTIFGEVVYGMDIVNQLEYIPTNQYNVPLDTIRIQKMLLAADYFKEE